MAQIFGVAKSSGLDERSLGAMGASLRRPWQGHVNVWTDVNGSVGLGSVNDESVPDSLDLRSTTLSGEEPVFLLDGSLYSIGGESVDAANQGQALAQTYRENGQQSEKFAVGLSGSFSIVVFDPREGLLTLATDRFCTHALYFTRINGGIAFASEIKALLRLPEVDAAFNARALSQAATYGRTFGDETIIDGICRLRPGEMLTFDVPTLTVSRKRYWSAHELVALRDTLTPEVMDSLVDLFAVAVMKRLPDGEAPAMSLSGGLDSRAIASVFAAQGVPAVTITTGFQGCADEKLAAKLAGIGGFDHSFLPLTEEMVGNYDSALVEAIFLRDVLALVGGYPGMQTQHFCRERGLSSLFRGHGGENAKLGEAWPFELSQRTSRLDSVEDVGAYLRDYLSVVPRDFDLQALFSSTSGLAVSTDLAADSLADELRVHGNLTAQEVLSLLYLEQNDGIEVPWTRNMFRGFADIRLPFLDHDFMDQLLAIDVLERSDTRIHQEIIRRHSPAMLRVTNSNTGARVDASALEVAIMSKLATAARRLNLPGYRHYHNMEKWLSGFLAQRIRSLLTEDKTLDRGLFDRDVMIRLLDESGRNPASSRLINFLLNLELWCRIFIDNEVPEAYAHLS